MQSREEEASTAMARYGRWSAATRTRLPATLWGDAAAMATASKGKAGARELVAVPFQKGHLQVPDGLCVRSLEYSACGGTLRVHLAGCEGGEGAALESGVPRDAWWRIESDRQPDRFVRLMHGPASLERMIKHYALLDADACMNTRDGTAWCAPAEETVQRLVDAQMRDVPVGATVRDLTGVPQRVANSGICWYAAVCFALFFHNRTREHVLGYFPRDLRQDAAQALRDPAAAERLRVALRRYYGVGDNIGQAPELDGQNGMHQIFILCARFGIPIRRFFMMGDEQYEITTQVRDMDGYLHDVIAMPLRECDPHLLVVRFKRGEHASRASHKPMPFLTVGGRKYRLVALLIGSEHCGHQIAAASPGGTVREWASCDADARRLGIGPTFWRTEKAASSSKAARAAALRQWWKHWRTMVPAINFHKGVCDMSPHNQKVNSLLAGGGGRRVRVSGLTCGDGACAMDDDEAAEGGGAGLTNIDLLYLSAR